MSGWFEVIFFEENIASRVESQVAPLLIIPKLSTVSLLYRFFSILPCPDLSALTTFHQTDKTQQMFLIQQRDIELKEDQSWMLLPFLVHKRNMPGVV